jgi:hypothetical protein
MFCPSFGERPVCVDSPRDVQQSECSAGKEGKAQHAPSQTRGCPPDACAWRFGELIDHKKDTRHNDEEPAKKSTAPTAPKSWVICDRMDCIAHTAGLRREEACGPHCDQRYICYDGLLHISDRTLPLTGGGTPYRSVVCSLHSYCLSWKSVVISIKSLRDLESLFFIKSDCCCVASAYVETCSRPHVSKYE